MFITFQIFQYVVSKEILYETNAVFIRQIIKNICIHSHPYPSKTLGIFLGFSELFERLFSRFRDFYTEK